MDILKKIFPMSWVKAKDSNALVKGIILYIIGAVIAAAVVVISTTILTIIPIVGPILAWVIGTLGGFIGLYTLIGIILLLLSYFEVLKD